MSRQNAIAAVIQALQPLPQLSGAKTIDISTTSTNTSLLGNVAHRIVPTAACFVTAGSLSNLSAQSGSGLLLNANEAITMNLSGAGYIAAVCLSGSAGGLLNICQVN